MRLNDVQLFRMPRPPEFFNELQAFVVLRGQGWIEVNTTAAGYGEFSSRWAAYRPTPDDIKRATSYVRGRSLVAKTVDMTEQLAKGIVGLTVSYMGTKVPDEVLATRTAACRGCPSNRPASGVSAEWCDLCGCAVSRKRRIPSERCPALPALWGEHLG